MPLADFRGKVVLLVKVPAVAVIPRNPARWPAPTISAGRSAAPIGETKRLSVPENTTVSFPPYSKVSVKGDDQTPLY